MKVVKVVNFESMRKKHSDSHEKKKYNSAKITLFSTDRFNKMKEKKTTPAKCNHFHLKTIFIQNPNQNPNKNIETLLMGGFGVGLSCMRCVLELQLEL